MSLAIHFHCVHCDQPLEIGNEHAGEKIQCPHCQGDIEIPFEYRRASAPTPQEPKPSSPTRSIHEPAPRLTPHEKVRGNANALSAFGRFNFLAGVIILLIALASYTRSGQEQFGLLYAAAGVFGLGFWLQILAQIMFVRAATEKIAAGR